MADLQQDAHAVAGPPFGVLAGAVLQMLDDGQRVADRLVAFAALDVHHGADAAGIVLKPGVIQAGGGCAFVPTIHSYPILSLSGVQKNKKRPWQAQRPARNAFVPLLPIIPCMQFFSSDRRNKSNIRPGPGFCGFSPETGGFTPRWPRSWPAPGPKGRPHRSRARRGWASRRRRWCGPGRNSAFQTAPGTAGSLW